MSGRLAALGFAAIAAAAARRREPPRHRRSRHRGRARGRLRCRSSRPPTPAALGRVEGLGDSQPCLGRVRPRRPLRLRVRPRRRADQGRPARATDRRARSCRPATRSAGRSRDDGRLVAVSNYEPGGVRVFDAVDPGTGRRHPGHLGRRRPALQDRGPGRRAGRRLRLVSLYDAGEIWVADLDDPARAARSARFPASASCPTTATSRRTAATISPACSARTASRSSICGISQAACAASSTATAAARSRCRSTRCRTSRAGPAPATSCSCPRSAATSCCVVDRRTWKEAGRIPVARPARLRRGPARRARRSGSTSPTRTTTSSR